MAIIDDQLKQDR